jgi:hypothetical protein
MPIPGPNLFGHVYDWREVDEYLSSSSKPVFAASGAILADSGKGKVALLHEIVERVLGKFPIHLQTIGDCVSHGFGLAVDIVKCVDIDKGESEEFFAETATEAIYAYSRVEVGGGRLGNGDGSCGSWAAQTVKDGTLARKPYGKYDLTNYSGSLARDWGRRGVGLPDSLESIAAEHTVNTASLVNSYEQARDAIFNGYPVPVCSNQGFTDQRDSEGFAQASGSWSHCMCFIGSDDESRRPGLLCMNSWGPNWIGGPKRHGQPDGSFWVDADTANRMLSRNPDSYALSGFNGFPAQNLFEMI